MSAHAGFRGIYGGETHPPGQPPDDEHGEKHQKFASRFSEGLADSLKKYLEEKVLSANRLHEAGEWIEKRRIRMKKLLILAGLGVHSKVVETAKKMGIYTVVTDYLEDSPEKRLADERLMYDSAVALCRYVFALC